MKTHKNLKNFLKHTCLHFLWRPLQKYDLSWAYFIYIMLLTYTQKQNSKCHQEKVLQIRRYKEWKWWPSQRTIWNYPLFLWCWRTCWNLWYPIFLTFWCWTCTVIVIVRNINYLRNFSLLLLWRLLRGFWKTARRQNFVDYLLFFGMSTTLLLLLLLLEVCSSRLSCSCSCCSFCGPWDFVWCCSSRRGHFFLRQQRGKGFGLVKKNLVKVGINWH